jgi:hypothetical protein
MMGFTPKIAICHSVYTLSLVPYILCTIPYMVKKLRNMRQVAESLYLETAQPAHQHDRLPEILHQ